MVPTPLRQLRLVKAADVYRAGVPAGVLHLADAVGIPAKLAAGVIHEQIAVAEAWIGELGQLPFDANRIRDLRRLVRARIRHIQPDI